MAKKRTAERRSPQEIFAGRDPRKSVPTSGPDARELIFHLKEHLVKDLTEEELAQAMGISVTRLRTLTGRMYASEEQTLRGKTATRIFVDFTVRQLGCIRKLDAIADACLAGNQAAGAVGAVKAKADLYHRILTTGQELGVLARQPKEVRVLGRIDVTHMTTEDLKRQVAEENRALLKLVDSLNGPATDRALLAEAVVSGDHANGDGQNPDAPSRAPDGR